MSYTYSDATRISASHTLPDVEVFQVSQMEAHYNRENLDHANEFTITEEGWYFWFCLPGCLPDSVPHGPFESEEEALQSAIDV